MATKDGKAVLHYPGGEFEMDIVKATEGNDGIALGKMLQETGLTTFDPGYTATGSTESKITYIDGGNGILRYRGYPIEQLAEKATFNEVSYLLIHGHLPSEEEIAQFNHDIRHHTLLDEDFRRAFSIFPRGAHPMQTLASSVNILASYYQDELDPLNEEQRNLAAVRLMAKVPMLAAYAYRASKGEPYMYPDNNLNARENFLRMMFGYPTADYEVDPVVVDALDKLLILHADHEQNCSTSTVRMVASSGASMFVSIAAGINALSGPLHGGANQAVLEMLEDIQQNHGGDELLDLAMKLEEIALADDYFVSRKLYPNVDFYTGLIYRAMGFPTDFFTVLFAIGRLPGWIAQFNEQVTDPASKINRPRQIYTGETERDFVPRDQR